MPQFDIKLPDVTIKAGAMPSPWSPRAKAGALLLALGVYVLLLLLLKALYARSQRMDHIEEMARETEQLLQSAYTVDQRLAGKVARLAEMLSQS